MVVHRPGTYEISMPDDDQHTLRIQRVRRADVGALVVMANNQFGSDLCTLELALAGLKPNYAIVCLVKKNKNKISTNLLLPIFVPKVSSLIIEVTFLKRTLSVIGGYIHDTTTKYRSRKIRKKVCLYTSQSQLMNFKANELMSFK